MTKCIDALKMKAKEENKRTKEKYKSLHRKMYDIYVHKYLKFIIFFSNKTRSYHQYVLCCSFKLHVFKWTKWGKLQPKYIIYHVQHKKIMHCIQDHHKIPFLNWEKTKFSVTWNGIIYVVHIPCGCGFGLDKSNISNYIRRTRTSCANDIIASCP